MQDSTLNTVLSQIKACLNSRLSLYKLNKWHSPSRNVTVGDIVVMREDGLVPSWGSTNTGMESTTGMAKKIKFPATNNLIGHAVSRGS